MKRSLWILSVVVLPLIGCGPEEGPPITHTTFAALGTSIPYLQDFDSGVLDAYWTTASTNEGRITIDMANGPHSGTHHAVMDDSLGNPQYSLNELTLNVDLSGASGVGLRFFAREYSDEPNALPLTFSGSANGDGVAISDDGNNWYRVVDFTPLTSVYQRFDVDLDAAAAAAGMSFAPDFYIRFSQYDNYSVGTDGIAIDSVAVGTNMSDTVAPTGTLVIDGGAASSAVSTVTLTTTGTDTGGSGLSQMSFSNDGISWSPWEPFATTKAWDLTDAAYGGNPAVGTKTVYLRLNDGALNVSTDITDDIDYAPPPQPATFPFSETFEYGGLGPYWQGQSTAQGRIRVTTSFGPNTGSYHLLMDDSIGDTTPSRNELDLQIDLLGQTAVVLVFYAREYTDEPHVLPDTFSGSANGDGVAISADGNTWYRVADLANDISSSYAEYVVNLDQEIANRGINYNGSFRVRFQQYDDAGATSDGIAFDDIQIFTPPPDLIPPTGSIVIANGAPTTQYLVVDLNLSATDTGYSGLTDMRFSNDGSTWSTWEPYATTKTGWDLSQYGGNTSAGAKAAYVQYRDGAGNVSISNVDTINFNPPGSICAATTPGTAIGVNDTQSGALVDTDAQYVWDTYPNRYVDGYDLTVGGAGPVTVTVSSSDFDPIVYVYELTGCVFVGRDLDGGTGTDAELTFAVTPGSYRIVVASTNTNRLGNYTITTSGTLSDVTPPTGTVLIDGGAATTQSLFVTLDLNATDTGGSGMAGMAFSNDGITFSPWEPYDTTKAGWDLTSFGGDATPGLKTVFAQFRDGAGNVSVPVTDDINYVVPTPASFPFVEDFESGSFDPWWFPRSSATGRIQVTGTNTPRGSYHVLMDSSVNSSYSNNELILTIDLATATNVELRFYAKDFNDESNALPLTYTGSTNGDGVSISADGSTWYRVWNGATVTAGYRQYTVDLDAAIAAAGIAYNGLFRVKLQQYDNFSVATDGLAYDDIEVVAIDTIPPTGTILIEGGAATTNNPVVTINLTAVDTGGSGLADMSLSNDGVNWAPWEAFSTIRAGWNLTNPTYGGTPGLGTKTAYVRYRDGSGNVSVLYRDGIDYVDDTPPTGTVTIEGGAATTRDLLVTLDLNATDTGGSSLADMSFSNDGSSWSTWSTYNTVLAGWDLSQFGGDATPGTKTVYARFRDGAGNISTPDTDTIDYTPPVPATVPFLEDWETGTVGNSWITQSTAAGRIQVATTDIPRGTYHLLMDASVDLTDSNNELILLIDLATETNADLSFYAKQFTDEPNVLPVSFVGSADGDGVSISADGNTWYRIWDSTTAIGATYQPFTIDLDQAAQAAGISFNGSFQIKFQQFDNFGIPTDGYAWDDIAVTVPDTTPPTGTVVINGGAASTATLIVSLDLTAADTGGSGLADMAFSNDSVSWSTWEPYNTSRASWDLSLFGGNTTPGTKTVYARFRDGAGNVSTSATDTIDFAPPDTTPPTGTILIEGSAATTTTLVVGLDLNASDTGGSGLADMAFSNDGTTWSTWEPYNTSRAGWDLAAFGGDVNPGMKTVYARFRDGAGNVSATVSDTIDYNPPDTTPPTGTVLIEGGAATTTTLVVSLGLNATDTGGSGLSDMSFSSDGTTWSPWEPYATTKSPWDLASFGGDATPGTKTVYARFRDGAGNVSTSATDTIDYAPTDTTPPTGTVLIEGGAATTTALVVNLGLNATDTGGSGLADMSFSNNGIAWSNWSAYNVARAGWDLSAFGGDAAPGTKTVYARFRDGAGNVSTSATDTIDYAPTDTTPPTGTVDIASGAATTSDLLVTLDLNATDTGGSGLAEMAFSNDGVTWSAWEAYATTKVDWDLSLFGGDANPGIKTVYARFRDGAGNVSASATDTIDYTPPDTTPPAGMVDIEGGALTTATLVVALDLNASDTGGSGLTEMAFSNDGGTWTTWEAYHATRAGWDLADAAYGGDPSPGTKTVYARFRDGAGNVSTEATDTIDYTPPDTTPPTGTVDIDNGAISTPVLLVDLNLNATDTGGSGLAEMAFSNDGTTWAPWEVYTSTKVDWDLSLFGGDANPGIKTVYAVFRDGAGNESAAVTDTIDFVPVDATSPTGTVEIENGAATTPILLVSLTMTASDTGGSGLAEMAFSNDGTTWSNWSAYAATRAGWDLSLFGGDASAGIKTVSAKFRDGAGNESAAATDTIDFVPADTTPPTGTILINGDAATTGSLVVTLDLSATDTGGSGLTEMAFSNDGTTWSSWATYTATKANWDLSNPMYGGDATAGIKTAYVQYRDGAGNVSAAASDTIEYVIADTIPPTGTVLIENDTSPTTTLIVALNLDATDTGGSGLAEMSFSNDGTSWSSWSTFTATRTGWNLGDPAYGGDATAGTKTAFARFRDGAGNVSLVVSDTIEYNAVDTVPPTAPSNLTATAISSARVDLAWDAATDDVAIFNYTLERSENGTDWSVLDTTVLLTYEDFTVAPNRTYWYRVRAADTAGNVGPFSNEATVTTPVTPTDAGVTDGTAQDGGEADASADASTIDSGVSDSGDETDASTDAGVSNDAASADAVDVGTGVPPIADNGCSCSFGSESGERSLWSFLVLMGVILFRRRML